jgi:hypothetical protein
MPGSQVSGSRSEQETGADGAQRHRQSVQSLKADEGKARGAGRRCDRTAADHREARGNRTTSGRLINANPAIAGGSSPVSAKLAGLLLLKHPETRHLAAGALYRAHGEMGRVPSGNEWVGPSCTYCEPNLSCIKPAFADRGIVQDCERRFAAKRPHVDVPRERLR